MKPLHPLINPESAKHYDTKGRPTSIEEMEAKMTVNRMIGAMEYNIYKIEYRKDFKGQKESDEYKLVTYKNYLDALIELLAAGIEPYLSVQRAWQLTGRVWSYR